MSDSIIYVGMDVHKDFVMMAVLPADAPRPTRVERVPNEPTHLRRFFRRWVPEERVRDLVRCREVLQRELIRARHYLVKFLARRGLVYREGTPWAGPHERWLQALARSGALSAEDATVFGEYRALIAYVAQRRAE